MKRKILNRKKRKHDRDICEIYLNNHLYDFLRFCEIKIARASDHPCTIRDLRSDVMDIWLAKYSRKISYNGKTNTRCDKRKT